jgi:hypothetical protein
VRNDTNSSTHAKIEITWSALKKSEEFEFEGFPWESECWKMPESDT